MYKFKTWVWRFVVMPNQWVQVDIFLCQRRRKRRVEWVLQALVLHGLEFLPRWFFSEHYSGIKLKLGSRHNLTFGSNSTLPSQTHKDKPHKRNKDFHLNYWDLIWIEHIFLHCGDRRKVFMEFCLKNMSFWIGPPQNTQCPLLFKGNCHQPARRKKWIERLGM